jgi:D-beta-D-heptose 7-phosphate kinase/D-beta-D-heptose 1-phosphate adenosyltransferase
MNNSLTDLIGRFAGRNVLVLGEAMLDTYLEGTSDRLCREAPVPIVALSSRRDAPGGAANAALNAHALGASVRFLSVVGSDAEGARLRRLLHERGLNVDDLREGPSRSTLAKTRVLAASQLLLRFDQGSTGPIDPATEEAVIERLVEWFPRSDAVIISDYGYGILTPRVIAALAELQLRAPRVVVADSKDLTAYRGVGLTAVKPNYEEAVWLIGSPSSNDGDSRIGRMAADGARILEVTGARIAAVTLDSEGALVFERDRPPYRTYAQPAPHARAAGAGDTFLAALALGLAAGGDTTAAAELASAAASVVVRQEGTVPCTASDLRDQIDVGDKLVSNRLRLAELRDSYRRAGRRVVFTNGCFDILHRGHITYLSRAKALGDLLIVGVNSDESIRRLKGPSRPINSLDDRVQVLAALSCIDHVVPFDEDTPCRLIEVVRPDVFAKGGDYTRDRLPEAELVESLGGVVRILSFIADRSTTDIIERIRRADPGGEPGMPRAQAAADDLRTTAAAAASAKDDSG